MGKSQKVQHELIIGIEKYLTFCIYKEYIKLSHVDADPMCQSSIKNPMGTLKSLML